MLEKLRNLLKSLKNQQGGFTLIELAVILAVIGILAGVGVMKYVDVTQGAYKTNAQARLADIKSCIAMTIAKKGPDITVADVKTVIEAAHPNSTFNNTDGSLTWASDTSLKNSAGTAVVFNLMNGTNVAKADTDKVDGAQIPTGQFTN